MFRSELISSQRRIFISAENGTYSVCTALNQMPGYHILIKVFWYVGGWWNQMTKRSCKIEWCKEWNEEKRRNKNVFKWNEELKDIGVK